MPSFSKLRAFIYAGAFLFAFSARFDRKSHNQSYILFIGQKKEYTYLTEQNVLEGRKMPEEQAIMSMFHQLSEEEMDAIISYAQSLLEASQEQHLSAPETFSP